jgi:hypothetical protein
MIDQSVASGPTSDVEVSPLVPSAETGTQRAVVPQMLLVKHSPVSGH